MSAVVPKTWSQNGLFEVAMDKEVSYESVDVTVRAIREAVEYQQFKSLQLDIQSPGGDFGALKHYLWHLQGWRHKKVQVKTVGMINVASAAAIMLSMGDLGQRFAYPHTQLVYHFARLAEVRTVTAQHADYLKKHILEADNEILDTLIAHIRPQIMGQMFPKKEVRLGRSRFISKLIKDEADIKNKVRNDLERLFQLDRPISAEQAIDFYLLDQVFNQQNQEDSL